MLKPCFLAICLWCCSTSRIQANVIISEVLPYPETGDEWIELYNAGDQAVILSSWTLEDKLSTPSVLTNFPHLETLLPGTYLTVFVSNKLNNSGDGVTFKDPTDQIIDTMSYSSATQGLSWSRSDTTFILTTPSPNLPNLLPSPVPTPSLSPSPLPTPSPSPSPSPPAFDPHDLVLSEIMACPSDSEQEWLELYNPTPLPMILEAWHITDWAGNSRPITATILPYTYSALTWSSGLLNNTGDSLFIENEIGDIVASATVLACKAGTSFIWLNNSWQLTTTPTQNQPNQLTLPATPLPSPSPTATPRVSPRPSSSPTPAASPAARSAPGPANETTDQTASGQILGSVNESTATVHSSHSASFRLPLQTTVTPTASVAAFLQISPSSFSFHAAISVILGGSIIALSSAYLLYDHYENHLLLSLA